MVQFLGADQSKNRGPTSPYSRFRLRAFEASWSGEMDKKTKGAWIIHHTRKLQTITVQEFDQLPLAGKCGFVLSSMAAESQTTIP